jgi:hypothetical protein
MLKEMIELMEMTMFPMMKGMITDIPGTIEMILPILNPEILCGLSRWLCLPGVLIDVIRFMVDMMMGSMK